MYQYGIFVLVSQINSISHISCFSFIDCDIYQSGLSCSLIVTQMDYFPASYLTPLVNSVSYISFFPILL
jgi:hypothetical protein